ncbi:MAG: signal peptide peptidase SppA [Nitrospiraceae bacterium]|nr:signal peptide peptidase SppA [Nitrospiraceae bacterium]
MVDTTDKSRGGCAPVMRLGCLFALVIAAAFAGFFVGVSGMETGYGPGVAVLDINAEMLDEQHVLDQLDDLLANPDTCALVLRVDSPGGVLTVAEEIYNAVKRAEEKGIPIVASMGSTAASGAYFVCLAADRIFANRSSLTGSIGVMVEYTSPKDLLDRIGIRFDTITSGEFKGMGSWGSKLTERQRLHMQEVVSDFHALFVETVARERDMDLEKAKDLADGRLFTGRQAVEAGLIDEIGDLQQAVLYAARQAGFEEVPRVIRADELELSILDVLERFSISFWGRLEQQARAPKFTVR